MLTIYYYVQILTCLFAYDCNLFISNTNYSKLEKLVNDELSTIDHWMKSNKLTINYTKTKYTRDNTRYITIVTERNFPAMVL